MSDPSVDAPPKVKQQPKKTAQQLADINRATLLAVQQLSQQLKETREQLQSQLQEQLR